MRVYYAWSDGGEWRASTAPRFEFASRPYLFKLQMAGYPASEADLDTSDPCVPFLNDFIPVWRNAASSLEAAL
jgi:hypothetical protein